MLKPILWFIFCLLFSSATWAQSPWNFTGVLANPNAPNLGANALNSAGALKMDTTGGTGTNTNLVTPNISNGTATGLTINTGNISSSTLANDLAKATGSNTALPLESWLARLTPTVSVIEKGAYCDDVHDDSPAFTAAIAAVQAGGGTVLVPATGHACLLNEGITVSSAGQSGVTLQGTAGMYWPGPYDNTASDWTKYGSWIHCADTVNSCITLNGNGSSLKRLSFWYTQPTPPGTACGAFCTMTHNWAPTNYPYTITIAAPQNFNNVSDINIINATNCIDIEGPASGVGTIFTYLSHLHLGCFNTGTKFVNVDNAVDIHDATYTLWWYQFNPNVVGYTEGDSTHQGHKIDWDMYYLSGLHAEGIEFYESYAAMRATDSTVTSGLGGVTFGAQALQLSNISFNQVCQAVTLASSTTHFSARMSNVILNVDPQTSNSTQCAGYVPYAFNIASDNADLSITNLDGYETQSIANVGGGNAGLLHLYGARVGNYSFFYNGSPAFNINSGAALDMPYDMNAILTTNANAAGRINGNPNWPLTTSGVDIEGRAGTTRQFRFLNAPNNGSLSVGRWGFRMDNSAESGNNQGSNLFFDRYGDNGSYIDSPVVLNRATGMLSANDGFQATLPKSCAGQITGAQWNNNSVVNICP